MELSDTTKEILPEAKTGESPFRLNHLKNLYTHPRQFFASDLSFEKNSSFLLAVTIFGMALCLETNIAEEDDEEGDGNILHSLAKFFVKSYPIDEYGLIGSFFESWFFYWILVISIGFVFGGITCFIGGLWYDIRVSWSGAQKTDDAKTRLVYLYVSLAWALPTVLIGLIDSLIYPLYSETFTVSQFWLWTPVFVIFPIWSIVVSYRAVTGLFDLKKTRAMIWFLILPCLYPLSQLSYILDWSFQN